MSSLESYGQLLACFYGLYAPLEQRLESQDCSTATGINLTQRQKAHLIPIDLTALGWTKSQINSIAWCKNLPEVHDPANALGTLYVLEGSTLGGQVICREAQKRLDLSAQHGCSFFAGYGEQTRPMWQDFGEKVAAFHRTHPQSETEIIASANETFTCFKEWIQCRAT